MHKFSTAHKAIAADITNDRVFLLQLSQAIIKLLATLLSIQHEVMALYIVYYANTSGRGYRVSAKGRGTRSGVTVSNLG